MCMYSYMQMMEKYYLNIFFYAGSLLFKKTFFLFQCLASRQFIWLDNADSLRERETVDKSRKLDGTTSVIVTMSRVTNIGSDTNIG